MCEGRGTFQGELDLTLNKNHISTNQTPFTLLRGRNIKEFMYSNSEEYVYESFIDKKANLKDIINKERLVCQQISNIHSSKRLKFCLVPPKKVLGNSCNFITLEENTLFKSNLSINYLLAILNSNLLNWRFNITNSNNHISNYELLELPIILPTNNDKEEVENIVKTIKNNPDTEILKKLNNKVYEIYGLNKKEIGYIETTNLKI